MKSYCIDSSTIHRRRYSMSIPQNDLTVSAALISHWLCYFNSAINPVIYNFMSGKFVAPFFNSRETNPKSGCFSLWFVENHWPRCRSFLPTALVSFQFSRFFDFYRFVNVAILLFGWFFLFGRFHPAVVLDSAVHRLLIFWLSRGHRVPCTFPFWRILLSRSQRLRRSVIRTRSTF